MVPGRIPNGACVSPGEMQGGRSLNLERSPPLELHLPISPRMQSPVLHFSLLVPASALLLPASPCFSLLLPASPCLSPLLPASPRYSPLLPATPRFSLLLPASPYFSPLLPAAPRCSPLLPAAPRCSLLLPAAPCFSPLLPAAPRCSRQRPASSCSHAKGPRRCRPGPFGIYASFLWCAADCFSGISSEAATETAITPSTTPSDTAIGRCTPNGRASILPPMKASTTAKPTFR
jgi:hypothetical protein